MTPYKLHLLQHLMDTDKPARKDFCTQMQAMLEQDDLMTLLCLVTFHLTGKVNKHNTRI